MAKQWTGTEMGLLQKECDKKKPNFKSLSDSINRTYSACYSKAKFLGLNLQRVALPVYKASNKKQPVKKAVPKKSAPAPPSPKNHDDDGDGSLALESSPIQGVALIDLEDGMCRAPLGGGGFCGVATAGKSSWCPGHKIIMTRKGNDVSRVRPVKTWSQVPMRAA